MSAIDWIKHEDGSKFFVKNLKVTLRDGKLTIIFHEFNNETRVKIEGKIILDKVTDFQQKNGVITYATNNGSPKSYPFTISGQFSDENYDEFKGDWLEERVLYSVTISLDELEIPIEDSKTEESLDIFQAEKLLTTFTQINASLPQDKVDGEDSDNIDPLSEITLDLYKAKRLIQDFKRLEKPPERKKAFLEIIGLSHLEAVSSKALAFFFDSDGVHQLKDLCVQALFDCILDRVKSKSEPAISIQSVEREVSTEEGSRIDIIIDTYDDLIIIENKLFHTVNNPFESYVNYGKLRRGERNGHYIILGIHKPETLPEHFKFISHFDLADAIRNRLGDYLMDADQHYVTLLVDYLHALDDFNPNSRIGKMEQAIVNFFGENHSLLTDVYYAKQHFIDYAEQQIQKMKSQLDLEKSTLLNYDEYSEDVEEDPDNYWLGYNTNSQVFNSHTIAIQQEMSFYFSLGCYTRGIFLTLVYYGNLNNKRKTPENCLNKLREIADGLGIAAYSNMDDYADDAEYLILKQFKWNESAESVVNQILPTIKQIETALNFDKEA